MDKSCRKGLIGAMCTVTKFCMAGFWTPLAVRMAKKMRPEFVVCHLLDEQPMKQQIEPISKDRLVNPGAWSNKEIDEMGLFICHSEVNKSSTTKVWGAMLEDINSRVCLL